MTRIKELYGFPATAGYEWPVIVRSQTCPFVGRKCLKSRKSNPSITIGSCAVAAGAGRIPVLICPIRLLERRQVFSDCIHLLTRHEPGNELHVLPEIGVPGGSVDYCLVSVRDGSVADFVGIELQTVDTTGTVWPERQRFLQNHGVRVRETDSASLKPFGFNWKMTAKTILVQLHHKIATFEHLSRHLVLVYQDVLHEYMIREFDFRAVRNPALLGHPMHFHAYTLAADADRLHIRLANRHSTDSRGIAQCLGLQSDARVEFEKLIRQLESRISPSTLLTLDQPPVPVSLAIQSRE